MLLLLQFYSMPESTKWLAVSTRNVFGKANSESPFFPFICIEEKKWNNMQALLVTSVANSISWDFFRNLSKLLYP